MPNEINLSPDELLAELTSSTSSTLDTPIASSSARKKNFLTRQFVCFSTPVAVVYFQGVIPMPASGIPDLAHCMRHAKMRKLNNPLRANAQVESLLTSLPKIMGAFYSSVGKAAQLHFIEALIKEGVVIRPEHTLSRTFALEAMSAYVSAMADFLIEGNYASPEDYLAQKVPTDGINSLDALASALAEANLDDWS